MPRSTYQLVRSSIQYLCHSSSSPGLTKNSISICSNSRVRKMKLPGVISLRKLLPIWAMPNGGLRRLLVTTLAKLKIGRAHVCTQVHNAHIVCRLLLENTNTDSTLYR